MSTAMISIPAIITIALLGSNSLYDIKKKEILLVPTLAAGAAGAVWTLTGSGSVLSLQLSQQSSPLPSLQLSPQPSLLPSLLLSLIPGLFLLGVSLASHGHVGAGDALLLCAAGVWSGAESMLLCLFLALLLVSVTAAVFRIMKKPVREVPFVPFLLAGFLIQFAVFAPGS